ncbi:sensor histidine kinase [Bacillus salacetis]|uniref:histidine kinase n=1 Tax=Bacillus salacetis TaxID=2315464 RepID=A0A3A1QTW5_9BACI|nr:sensor histidine kinase [Bacillus salacetis]RIW31333.1 sensor histidine kinase [Bacillus salacetis]
MKLTLLSNLRLVMFLLVSYIYYSSTDVHTANQLIFVIVAAIGFCLNHLLLATHKGNQHYPIPLALDSLLILGFVYFYPASALYLILFGVNAVTLFLIAEDKRVLRAFSISFFVMWGGCIYYIYHTTGMISSMENAVNFTFIMFAAIVGRLIHKLSNAQSKIESQYGELNETHTALKDAHQQLHHYAKQVEELTLVRERNRISGEIHDTVGHKMTALLVQLQVAKELLETQPDKSRQTMQLCEDLARNTLQEIRLSVRTLKDQDEPQSFVPTVRKLLEDYQVMTGLSSSFTVKGDTTRISISIQLDMTRIIQEAVTNAVRHGQAKECSVNIEVSDTLAQLIIQDDGAGSAKVSPGFGMKNMRDRVHEHGGTIVFESTSSEGFRVKAGFPLKEMKWQLGGA